MLGHNNAEHEFHLRKFINFCDCDGIFWWTLFVAISIHHLGLKPGSKWLRAKEIITTCRVELLKILWMSEKRIMRLDMKLGHYVRKTFSGRKRLGCDGITDIHERRWLLATRSTSMRHFEKVARYEYPLVMAARNYIPDPHDSARVDTTTLLNSAVKL